MSIKKISNIQYSPSEEKIANNWKQIRSLRIKLLQDTDWIFVDDSNLTKSCINAWIAWRDKVKKSKEISDINEAAEYLNALHNNRPELNYIVEKPTSVESYKKLLHEVLKDSIKKMNNIISDEFGGRDILLEKFEEAIRYKNGSDNYILLEIESDYSKLSLDDVADKAISNRKEYLKRLVKIERSKHLYLNHINAVDNFADCDKILDAILALADKKWILTST